MKWVIRIAFFISIGINGYLIIDEFQFAQRQEYEKIMNDALHGDLSKTTWKQGLEIFNNELKKKDKALLDKKYYYINVWTNWCKPCIREMPWLDSLAGKLDKNVGYFFVSDLSDEAAKKCIRKTNYNLQHFVFLNNMHDFVSAICDEKGTKNVIYPTVLILSNKGELLHFSYGAYNNAREAAAFTELINRLE